MKLQLLIASLLLSCVLADIPDSEVAALKDLYNAFNGGGWNNHKDWMSNINPCYWNGITCSKGSGGSFANVIYVDLSGNNLRGQLPKSISDLTNLQVLKLASNPEVSGDLEILSEMKQLKMLNISVTRFYNIPDSWANLENMEYLYFREIAIEPGPFPSAIENMKKLKELDFGKNPFTGDIPYFLGGLKLEVLMMDNTLFGGLIPDSFYNFKDTLRVWDASHIPVTPAPIPSWIGEFKVLEVLKMTDFQRNGRVPDGLWQLMPTLKYIWLNLNHLKEDIPSGYFKQIQIIDLVLADNQFSSTCPLVERDSHEPSGVCDLSNVKWACPGGSGYDGNCSYRCKYSCSH